MIHGAIQGIDFARFDADGRYWMTGSVPKDSSTLLEPDVYVGTVDPDTHYHDHTKGGPVPLPARPSEYHHFHYPTKTWCPDADAAARVLRAEREALLIAADWKINTLEDDGEDASAWRRYRKALRDMPKQEGFPLHVTWPTAPA